MESNNFGKMHICCCCGKGLFSRHGSYEICTVCGWEDDPVQEADPDFAGGSNRYSLNEMRKRYIGGKSDD